jgi:predicted nucleic acid-binding protein
MVRCVLPLTSMQRSASIKEDSFWALRTLGEVYAVLIGLRARPRITGADGMASLEQIREKLTVISLTEEEYVSAIQSVSETIVGGAAYDALIARCATKAGRRHSADVERSGLY